MLDELTGYSSFGSTRLLLSMIRLIDETGYTEDDLRTMLATDIISLEMASYQAAIDMLKTFGLCSTDSNSGTLKTSGGLEGQTTNSGILSCISSSIVHALEPYGVFAPTRLKFDPELDRYYLPLSMFPLRLAPFRNLLVDIGSLERIGKRLYLSDGLRIDLEHLALGQFNGMTPQELYKKLDDERLAGELAEQFVMEYEAKRLGENKADQIRQVSAISVSAGYDIASFNSPNSPYHDRLIEVKAIGHSGFFFSSNELEVAKVQGHRYFIYLIDLAQSNTDGYEPRIITDPANYFECCDDWRITASSYHIVPLD